MGWKTINGSRYYYRLKRIGGRVTTEYVGAGELASCCAFLDEAERQEREERREQRRELERRQRDLGESIDRIVAEAARVVADVLRANGCHNHRGEWRRRRMGTELAAETNLPPAPSVPAPSTRRKEFSRLVDDWLIKLVVESTVSQEGTARSTIVREIREAAAELAGPGATPAEVMAAEAAAVAWYAVRMAEANELAHKGDRTLAQSAFAMKRTDHASHRLNSALKTLALLKKLGRPTVQVVNIGRNQNIATMAATTT